MELSLKEGMPAPDFQAPDQDGSMLSLEQFHGSWLLLYFYPKDDTPGCTTEACGFRDVYAELRKAGAQVLGVSVDSVKSHGKFAARYELPFLLLSDEDRTIVNAYGVWQEKTLYGKTYMGTVRSSFLIDPSAIIRKMYPKVKPEEHASEILRDLAALAAV